jgi:hypothetical protein
LVLVGKGFQVSKVSGFNGFQVGKRFQVSRVSGFRFQWGFRLGGFRGLSGHIIQDEQSLPAF